MTLFVSFKDALLNSNNPSIGEDKSDGGKLILTKDEKRASEKSGNHFEDCCLPESVRRMNNCYALIGSE